MKWSNSFVSMFRCCICQRQRDDQPAARHHRGLRCDLWHGSGEPVSHQQQQPERGGQLQAEGHDRLRESGGGVWLAGGPGGGLPLLWLLFRPLRLESACVLMDPLMCWSLGARHAGSVISSLNSLSLVFPLTSEPLTGCRVWKQRKNSSFLPRISLTHRYVFPH